MRHVKLSDCLNASDINILRSIANTYQMTCSKHSKMALIQEILFSFRNRSFLSEHIPNWRHAHPKAMLRLCFDHRSVFTVEELEGVFQESTDPGLALEAAVRQGWLYPTTQFGGRLMYCIPEELHAAIRNAVIDTFESQVIQSNEGPLTYQEAGHAMLRDLEVFIEYVAHHDAKLTTDGSLYKKNMLQILELLEVPEAPLAGGWRFGYGRRFHDYPDRFALIYDFAYQQQFITERSEGLVVNEDWEDWVQTDIVERQKALVRYYISLYRRPILRLPQVVQILARVSKEWVRADSMLCALDSFVNEYYYDDRNSVWENRILTMLMHLGVIRKGVDENDVTWFQITKLGQQLLTPDALPATAPDEHVKQRILIVQPNFEIVVTADQPLVTAELAIFTELRQAGALRVYRITEDTVNKAMNQGHSVSSWLEFVGLYSQTPIPGNVERTLLDWERAFGVSRDSLTS